MVLNPYWPSAPPADAPPGARCAECVWHFVGGRGKPVDRCHRHDKQPIDPEATASPAYTRGLDCRTCGACCREAFHTVEVGKREVFAQKHPELLTLIDGRLNLPRGEGSCACLTKDSAGYSCTAYLDRPRSCRDFERGSENCLLARRRVKLTP